MTRRLALILVFAIFLGRTTALAADDAAEGRAQVAQALKAQGGEDRLRAIGNLQVTLLGYRDEIEESERPEGPYIVEFDTATEVHDWRGNRYRSTLDARTEPMFGFTQATVVDTSGVVMQENGGQQMPGRPYQAQLAHERMALSPERLLLTAAAAADLRGEPDVVLQSVPQHVVSFTLDGAPVRIFLNAYTHLPTAMDYSGPLARAGFAQYLSDVTLRTWYSTWWLAKGGIHYPLQTNTEINGYPDHMFVVKKLEFNAPLDESALAIPEAIRAKFDPQAKAPDLDARPLPEGREIAPGVLFFGGSWNTSAVAQRDGIVMIEAPISSSYSAQAIAAAEKHFAPKKVKAVITTSDSWPHIAGIREYVARGIPIYAVDLNRPILERTAAAPRTVHPDRQAAAKAKPILRLVSDHAVIGEGDERIELYPLRGETSERQMVVYFPARRLLYGSDPFQRNDDGTYFFPQTVSELMDAVRRNHLQVDTFYMMHIGPTPWSELQQAIDEAVKENSPTGKLM